MHRSESELVGEQDALNSEILSQATAVATFAVFLGILVYVMPPPWITDMNHPDFNPLVIIMALAALGLVWQAYKLMRLVLRRRHTGHSRMWVTSGTGVGRLGQTLEGKIQLGRAPEGRANGFFEVTLRCVEAHVFREIGEGHSGSKSPSHFVVWEQTISMKPMESRSGLIEVPFRFELPEQVGTMQKNASGERLQQNPYFRFRGAIFLPGFRRVWSSEDTAAERVWRLKIGLPSAGEHYQTEFVVPVQSD